MSIREHIITILEESLSPVYLKVEDFSEKHAGHAGYRDGGGSHIAVVIVSDAFIGKSLVERHRMLYDMLENEIRSGLHALKLKTLTAEEAERRKSLSLIPKG